MNYDCEIECGESEGMAGGAARFMAAPAIGFMSAQVLSTFFLFYANRNPPR